MVQGSKCSISSDFVCGENSKWGDFVVIQKDVVVGSNVKIGSFVVIQSGTRIADNVTIEDFVVLKARTTIESNCIIEDHSIVQSSAFIGAGTKLGTHSKAGRNVVIGQNCKFTAFCEIRDNCRLGNNVSMGSRGTLSAGTQVEDDVIMKYAFVVTDTPVIGQESIKRTGVLKRGSKFGASVTIMPGVSVGVNSEIGACSQVRQDVPDNEVWYGNPAKFFKKSQPRS